MNTGHFTRLSGEECRQLVRGSSVGRVCWLSGEGLQVLPVTYAVSGELIVFRVDPASVLGELAGHVRVAFEVDDIDVPTGTGWSVLVRGEAAACTPEQTLRLPLPWAPGNRTLTVAITPLAYSGRAVSADLPRS
ncbi:MAG: pyridoxamine 5'-phosphate oxidase family protein [Actinobacteria bacterium]|nr:pyridoxamine 5'-phosphate oxidase family protein [Actinomycetota bacterium]